MADIKQMQINGQLYEVPGNGDVSKGYVDQRDTQVLADAKAYADGKASEAQSAAITHSDNQDAQTLAAANQHSDEQDAQTLAAAKAYTDEHSSSYVLPAATRTELGGIKAAPAQAGDTKGVYIGADGMLHVSPDVLVVQATKEGGSWVADVGSETIRSFGGSVILKAEVDGTAYIYRYQRYDSARGAIFDQANLQPDAIERIEVIVDRSRNVTVVRTPYTPPGGEDGGYYFPAVTQDAPNTATFDFAPSKAGMPPVNPKTVTLPAGKDGAPGKTPVRGVDYWTTADQEQIVQDTLAALPTWKWEAV